MRENLPECRSTDEVYAFITEREVKGCVLFRFAAQSAENGEAKALLERLYQRGEAFLEKLCQARQSGVFTNRECTLADQGFYQTMMPAPGEPGRRVPEVLMFAIRNKHDDYLLCQEAADLSRDSAARKLLLTLAEENRRQRLELESYYEKEVINKI